jgi:hypothetical protein
MSFKVLVPDFEKTFGFSIGSVPRSTGVAKLAWHAISRPGAGAAAYS